MHSDNTPKPLSIEELKTFLKRHSMKITPQRVAVHNAMLALGHASADMVAEHITNEGTAKVTVASVYNILTTMADIGVYRHRMSANCKMYFDVNTFMHIHLYDTVSNTFRDIFDDELIETVTEKLRRRKFKGYNVEGFDIQILCHPSRRGRKQQH